MYAKKENREEKKHRRTIVLPLNTMNENVDELIEWLRKKKKGGANKKKEENENTIESE